MQARMTNPAILLPDAMQALFALNKATEKDGLSEVTRKLVHLRASQINSCSVCVHMHSLELRKLGEKDDRIFAVAAWRDTPWFTPAERAALALTEAVTRVADKSDPVPDDVWEEAVSHYDEKAISALLLTIALINVWNRLNAAVRQVAGAAWN
ncbi:MULTISPECIES: carboxymuconolactone decarboxylase family protein [Aminobacter]|uniref:Argininosuccinate synthase n=2 Tax=Aminobacter TaxID=31988 RepID=A0A380WGX3_AMIAI|nr:MULTISPECIES: carboxymuconolactone decarboxylase family protein [Aminobacter]MBB6465871.1 AhpD family alkylhydroperoxidase [Aminobacter lissarensis]MBE1204406.1 carboxymuconolactone decarboxylase family protein [Aminobacter carboxidus]TCS21644.1 AhpD family alkylhydroperoxidase [Aminobacter aminovorans]SUU87612.1 Argininosuccinate synthase [Aminobacter aminovorans]